MKKIIAIMLVLLILMTTGCDVKTRDDGSKDPNKTETVSTEPSADHKPVELKMLTLSADETVANVVRDQLKKAGFNVTVSTYPDSGTFNAAVDTESFDIRITSHSGAGSPDANVRGPFHSKGAWNTGGFNDPKLDEYIEKAAMLVGDESLEKYKEFEKYLVEEKAYQVPLYSALKTFAVNKNVVNGDSIEASVGGARWVWSTEYNDTSLNETRPYNMGINWTSPNSFDCVQGRDGSTYYQRTNINVPLIQCAMGGVTQTRGSLTKQYAVAEGNTDFYFLLRTDINFGTYKGGKAVDTGLPVAAEDVKFTYDRAMSDTVPNSVGKSYLTAVSEVNIISDIEQLKGVTASGANVSIFDALNEGIDKPFTKLAVDKFEADEDKGIYEVLHIKLSEPYPQQLVTLAAGQISIVCKERIEEVNAGITVDNYDPTKHVLYGDPNTMKKGVDHGMYFSGQYVLNYVDDYGSYLEINPGFAPEAEDAPKIKYVNMLAIADNSTQTAAFRNGELDEAMPTGENITLAEQDPNINIVKVPSVSVTSLQPILRGNSKMFDENLRKAVLYAINTDELIAVMGPDSHVPANSNLIMLNTGFRFQHDATKSKQFLEAYYESLK